MRGTHHLIAIGWFRHCPCDVENNDLNLVLGIHGHASVSVVKGVSGCESDDRRAQSMENESDEVLIHGTSEMCFGGWTSVNAASTDLLFHGIRFALRSNFQIRETVFQQKVLEAEPFF